ncbi:formylglycine-generating enzyme family protein [Candidatus Magnetaquicoccus inordinatus]|uniref:formylglycine-generating enzyme family protein n=1 Tax=Candidatus Magnetaquicoccus inordinatus TaxID=2496818 RepID=UPI00187D4067|nr:SUMF1/EgtB/PvdO family nonheme iron enzyme [Candidatus Magnetaquicoccus inordinatus]
MAAFNEMLRVRLHELLNSQGGALLQDPRRLEALLRDLSDGSSLSDLHLLMQGLKSGIPAQIVEDVTRGLPTSAILPRLVLRLEEAHIAAKAAQWCVNSWCLALGYELPEPEQPANKRKTPVDDRYPIHPQPLPSECSWTDPLLGMAFVWVPAGTFLLGDLFDEGGEDEQPVHEVTLDGFWLGKYPVTQGQWQQVMGHNPAYFQKGADYPVEQVSWEPGGVGLCRADRRWQTAAHPRQRPPL